MGSSIRLEQSRSCRLAVTDTWMDTRDDCRKRALRCFLAAEQTGDHETMVAYLDSAQEWVRLAAHAEGADYGMLAQPHPMAPNRELSDGGCLIRGMIYKRVIEFWTDSPAGARYPRQRDRTYP
jgi:hypothetical protein